jgi:phenylacetate-CoA ligase
MSIYSHVYQNLLMPLHGIVRNRRYVRHRALLERTQWWSRDRLLEFQWQELHRLLEHTFRSVPYYQEKYRKAGIVLSDIRTREDFARLPILTRAEVNENRAQLCSTEFRGKLLPHATGGSSGTPTRFFRTIESYDWRTAAKDRVYSWSGWRPGEKAAYLWGAPVGKVPRFQAAKTRAYDSFHRQLIINTFSQNDELWENVCHRITRFRPRVVVGYVSSLAEFSAFLLRRGLHIPPIEAVIAAAEPLYASTRQQIGEALGAPVFNTYGCREFMSLAGECPNHDGLHINVENVLVETALAPAAGPSEVLVTDLHNYGMPFIRYAIGDLAVMDDALCSCGRGLPMIQRIEGRVLDTIRTVDGRTVSAIFFRHILKDIPEISQYRVVQDSPSHVVLLVVLQAALSDRSQGLLQREMTRVFAGSMQWEINPVAEIPRLASGKHRAIVGLS